MIISKTPVRISFAGGSTDIIDYYQKEYGAVTSTTINKYVFITVNKNFGNKIRISYPKTEIVDNVEEIQHPIFRETLKMMNIDGGIEITSTGDIPGGTGLGSSSTFTVGLLNALYAFKGKYVDAETLAREACKVEIDILKKPIGKQDQYASAYGGLNHMRFNADETVLVEPIALTRETKEKLDKNLLLFYVGEKRKSYSILNELKKNIEDYRIYLDVLRNLAEKVAYALKRNDLSSFGKLLHEGWIYKKKIQTSNENTDRYYEKAMKAGAMGGKVPGALNAKGGGFLILYCEEKYQQRVRETLGLKEIGFHLEQEGGKIIYV